MKIPKGFSLKLPRGAIRTPTSDPRSGSFSPMKSRRCCPMWRGQCCQMVLASGALENNKWRDFRAKLYNAHTFTTYGTDEITQIQRSSIAHWRARSKIWLKFRAKSRNFAHLATLLTVLLAKSINKHEKQNSC